MQGGLEERARTFLKEYKKRKYEVEEILTAKNKNSKGYPNANPPVPQSEGDAMLQKNEELKTFAETPSIDPGLDEDIKKHLVPLSEFAVHADLLSAFSDKLTMLFVELLVLLLLVL